MAKEGQGSVVEWITLLIGLAALIFPAILHWTAHLASRDAWHIAIGGLAFLLLRGFWHSFSKYDELSEKQKPRLQFRCRRDIQGCEQIRSVRNGFDGTAFRVRVENISQTPIKDCEAYLVSIAKDLAPRWKADEIQLTFATDMPSKTIYYGKEEFIDVVNTIKGSNSMLISSVCKKLPFNDPMEIIFSETGEYILEVKLVSPSLPRAETVWVSLRYDFAGNDTPSLALTTPPSLAPLVVTSSR
jgi:hypothetical protein